MVWRNPLTNRFEAGDGPADGQLPTQAPEGIDTSALAPEPLNIPAPPPLHERGWTHPTDDGPMIARPGDAHGGGSVQSVADVLSGPQPDKQTPAYGPKKSDHDDVVGG